MTDEETPVSPLADYIYVSSVQMSSNNWDLRLTFGDRLPNTNVVTKVGVVMSHRHAKAMLMILQKQIDVLEETFGPIEVQGTKVEDERESEPESE